MASSFNVDQELMIRGNTYRFCEHPFAPGMPFGQEGRAAVVYQLASQQTKYALKVFKPRFSNPSLVTLADQLAKYAELKGLDVCARIVLTPRADADLLRQYPDLTYAVLMPWIEGQTWQETVMKKEVFTPQQSLALAHRFTNLLMAMEERGLAHCDLSGANVILEGVNKKEPILTLVDVEGMFAPGLPQPNILVAGSPGYAHHAGSNSNLWSSQADRFAGAILLAEMLSWCDPAVRLASQMESFFTPAEIQSDSGKFKLLLHSLELYWGENVAGLFRQAWNSNSLEECATFGRWMIALPDNARENVSAASDLSQIDPIDSIQILFTLAQRLESAQNFAGALATYQMALEVIQKSNSASGVLKEQSQFLKELIQKYSTDTRVVNNHFHENKEISAEPAHSELDLPQFVGENPSVGSQIAVKAHAKTVNQSKNLEDLMHMAEAAMRKGDMGKARNLLTEIISRNPNFTCDGMDPEILLRAVTRTLQSKT